MSSEATDVAVGVVCHALGDREQRLLGEGLTDDLDPHPFRGVFKDENLVVDDEDVPVKFDLPARCSYGYGPRWRPTANPVSPSSDTKPWNTAVS
jgi:hypothetical protein